MSVRRPKLELTIDSTRVRVYATRTELEVIFNDEDINDMGSEVICYPKTWGLHNAAFTAYQEWTRTHELLDREQRAREG